MQNPADEDCDQNNDEDRNYNSFDEHYWAQENYLLSCESEEREKNYMQVMLECGYVIEKVVGDGACLFRSIALQIFGNQDLHSIVRHLTMDYIVSVH